MIIRILLLSLALEVCYCLHGKRLSEDVTAYLGIPYAEAPVRELRLRDSVLKGRFDTSISYEKWPSRCIQRLAEEGRSEDCLFLNVFHKNGLTKETNVLLYITNDQPSEQKLAKLVSEDLTVVVAHAREGAFASFDSHSYATSDIVNIFKFLQNEKERFLFGEVTVMADGHLSETVSLVMNEIDAARAILLNGHTLTRTNGRDNFPRKAAYRLLKNSQCDLPSESQALDCLRALDAEEFVKIAHTVRKSFYPFGDPFRTPANRSVANKQIPTIYGMLKELPKIDYPVDANFTAEYSYKDFKQFLAGAIPDYANTNGPLLRRLALHQYVHTKNDKTDTYFLFNVMQKMMHDRDFIAPTHKLLHHLAKNKNNEIYQLQYGIDNPPTSCLQDGGWENEIVPFCDRLIGYYTRFASKGAPTQSGCDPENPTFPALKKSKRDYFVILHADGTPEWEFQYHKEAVAFWNDLAPSMNQIPLAGRRDAVFPEEQEISTLDEEDDIQMWHESAATDDSELTEEKALNDMPHFKQEL